MNLTSFEPNDPVDQIAWQLKPDGAVILKNQVPEETCNTVVQDLRESFDKEGKYVESDFNGYSTLRLSAILASRGS